MELSRPLKISPTLAKLEQAKAYLNKILPNYAWDSSSKAPSTPPTPHSSPAKTLHKACPPRLDKHHHSSALGKSNSIGALALTFHKVSLQTAQIFIVMDTEAQPMRPSITVSMSAMTGRLNMKMGLRIEGE